MRRLRYSVAASLDGFIAGPNGEYDWMVADTSIDFGALFAEFDTFVMGRRTYEVIQAQGTQNPLAGQRVIVVSRTLRPSDHPDVTVVGDDIAAAVAALKAEAGKDIWLFGGGVLFRSLLDAGLVDAVEVAVMPVLLGRGIRLLAEGRPSPMLTLTSSRILPSGIVMLAYDVGASPSEPHAMGG
jgi:dihydrofolate reductase